MSQTGETQLGDCAEEFHDCSQASSTSELDAARRDDSRHEEVGISAVSWNAATEAITSPATCAEGVPQLDTAASPTAALGKAATAAGGVVAANAEEAAASSATRSVVVELPDIEPDLCSICLDPFTTEDPANSTQCEHQYHLQCIMQWAQRSQDCPMCFKPLRLQEEALNELLPFGEYRPPEQATPSHVLLGLEAWELDRLLARLAVHGSGGSRGSRASRHSRSSRSRAAAAAAAGGAAAASSSSQDGQQPLGPGQQASTPIAMQRDAGANASEGDDRAQYPASWPPASHSRQFSRTSPSQDDGGSGSAAVDLRTRWAAVSSKAKESAGGFFSKTTKELKSLWGRPASHGGGPSNGHGPPRASSGSAT